MITEDYVSFEVAKLLKEKGFNGGCSFVINATSKGVMPVSWPITNSDIEDEKANLIVLPTLQVAMKWLRKVHNIFIQIDYVVLAKNFFEYSYELHDMSKGRSMAVSAFRDDYETYEEAIEAAIKYCLTNLI